MRRKRESKSKGDMGSKRGKVPTYKREREEEKEGK